MPPFRAGTPATRPGSASGSPQLGATPVTQASLCPGPSARTRALGPGDGGEDVLMNFPSGRLSASGTTLAAQLRQFNAGASWLQITGEKVQGGFSAVSLGTGGGAGPEPDTGRGRGEGGGGRGSGRLAVDAPEGT